MSWINSLYELYNANESIVGDLSKKAVLYPLFHQVQKAHVTVVINKNGDFIDAKVISKDDSQTMMPISRCRTNGLFPFPLCDKLQYVAEDYKKYGGVRNHGFKKYLKLLTRWSDYDQSNEKLKAVLSYVKKGRVIEDLVNCGVFICGVVEEGKVVNNENGCLLTNWKDKDGNILVEEWKDEDKLPPIMRVENLEGQSFAFIRWSVEDFDFLETDVWKDKELWKSWENFCLNNQIFEGANEDNGEDESEEDESEEDESEEVESGDEIGLCYVTGKIAKLSTNHPSRIRNSVDGAKIISSNDKINFTFRGNIFNSGSQACGISQEVSQKSHNMLRYLLASQGYRDEELSIVSWGSKTVEMPRIVDDTFDFLMAGNENVFGYTAEEVGVAVSKMVAGYSSKKPATEKIVVMAIKGVSKGRLAVAFYRELEGSDFWKNVLNWHTKGLWEQKISKDKRFFGVPSPKHIAEAAYGLNCSKIVKMSVSQKILTCIVDGETIPNEIVDMCVRNACKRELLETWEADKILGVACSVYKMSVKNQEYKTMLDQECKRRDYLFGRLLACYDRLESMYLYDSKQSRQTHATKLMRKFQERPSSTLAQIKMNVAYCEDKLLKNKYGFLVNMQKEIGEIFSMFAHEDFVSDKCLSGEFLLGYECQRAKLWNKTVSGERSEEQEEK